MAFPRQLCQGSVHGMTVALWCHGIVMETTLHIARTIVGSTNAAAALPSSHISTDTMFLEVTPDTDDECPSVCSRGLLATCLLRCLQTGPLGFLKVAAMPDQEELEAIAGEHPAPPCPRVCRYHPAPCHLRTTQYRRLGQRACILRFHRSDRITDHWQAVLSYFSSVAQYAPAVFAPLSCCLGVTL